MNFELMIFSKKKKNGDNYNYRRLLSRFTISFDLFPRPLEQAYSFY